MTESADTFIRPTLRPADTALDPADLGGARATRHSFARTMVRRAAARGWRITRGHVDLDAEGRGTVIFDIAAEGHRWSFVVFSQSIPEDERTDRVIAASWDVTAALVEGTITPADLDRLGPEVTRQEAGRAEPSTIIWTRANRSGRFFDYVVDRLASGQQPEADVFGLSPYLLRSTAFYSNGKFGLADFERFDDDHPFAVPYRAHMLAAWLLRELGYELAEHCATARSEHAARLDGAWRRYFGLGNATGLGMVPYVVNHPEVLDAWIRLRELPLAAVLTRSADPAGHDVARVTGLLDRASRYLAEQGDAEPTPYSSGTTLARRLAPLRALVAEYVATGRMGGKPERQPWQRLHEEAAGIDSEVRGIVATVLTELTEDLDEVVEAGLRCQENRAVLPRMRCAALRDLVSERYAWLAAFDFADATQTERFWFSSVNNEEPRRARAGIDPGERVQHGVDIARTVSALREHLAETPDETSVGEFLLAHPWHRGAVARVQGVGPLEYGELRANLLAGDFLPLHVQRLQLAVYGMDNFNPQSTDWLRVTLLSGAPRVSDLADGTADDDWIFTPRPLEAAAERTNP